MIPLLFNFNMTDAEKDATVKKAIKIFTQAGVFITDVTISKAKRSSGVSFKELVFTFNDSQTATLMIKTTGDIFKVKVNKREMPIKHQDNPGKAIIEIVNKLDSGRISFQKRLSKQKVKLPAKIKSTVATREKILVEREKELDMEIAKAEETLASLKK